MGAADPIGFFDSGVGGLCVRDAVRALRLGERSDRSRIRTLSASHAFDLLRRAILGLPLENS